MANKSKRPATPVPWSRDKILELGRSFQPVCVLAAAADLDLFDVLKRRPLTTTAAAQALGVRTRGLQVLLDALTALNLLTKRGGRYAVPKSVAAILTSDGPHSVLAMTQHQANCLRRWAQLARTIKTGQPALCMPSVRGMAGDMAAFIGAMDNISAPIADTVIAPLKHIRFRHLLDIGGASGTWTLAFLRSRPTASATLFDLAEVIPLAQERIQQTHFRTLVQLVAGNYVRDPLPMGADFAWISAIIHQNSRAENRNLFRKTRRALLPGGWLAIRDIVMEPDRLRPVAGALFAVNMLVGTAGGGTYTLAEIRADLTAAGFRAVQLLHRDAGMNSLVVARKPT